jgi:single-strand DNA-binding protein
VWNDKGGQRQEKTEWHRIVLWGKQAESLQEYLTKGKQIYVEGRLQTRQWDDKDGNKRYTTEIKADRITLLGGGGGGGRGASMDRGGSGAGAPGGPGGGHDEPPMEPITDDDIPF